MLKYATSLLFFVVVSTAGADDSYAKRLVGRWTSVDYPGIELTFRDDHTFANRSDLKSFPGRWRVEEGDVLVEIWPEGRGKTIDRVKFTIRGDRLYFGVHFAITEVDGKQVGEPEIWTTGVSFRKSRMR